MLWESPSMESRNNQFTLEPIDNIATGTVFGNNFSNMGSSAPPAPGNRYLLGNGSSYLLGDGSYYLLGS